jgi:hypothetical protein
VAADLGHGAGFLDVVWLSLTGELPTDTEREALSRAMTWLAPLHLGEGPAHAAVLARVAGAPDEVIGAISVVALGQRIHHQLQSFAPMFAWLAARTGPLPTEIQEPRPTDAQRSAWDRLSTDSARWFGAEHRLPVEPVFRREAAAWAILHQLGVRDELRLQALGTVAQLPTIMAEAACTQPGSVMRYPTLSAPPYTYVEDV